jgi:hypothetical protein
MRKGRKRTSVNEPVVVLLVGLLGIVPSGENDVGDTGRSADRIVDDRGPPHGSYCCMEELLRRGKGRRSGVRNKVPETHGWAGLVKGRGTRASSPLFEPL